MMNNYENPIIPGFNPDPSICRRGDDFYLVTSSFEYFPGVPVYHSKNLVNWELVSYCLTDKSQLQLKGCDPSLGIFAPTIRFHNGTFYMVTTNVSDKGNFIVHTNDVCARWSDPVYVKQGGIDPSLIFDGGNTYFCSTVEGNIMLCKINPLTGELLSPSVPISCGCGGICPEGPHIYKIGKYYYLMLAEGGTEYGHMVTIQRGEKIEGPYSPCPDNPILTHRNYDSPIQAVGHADMIEDQNGRFWLVCLGIRRLPEVKLHNLGRETFLTPVKWENGWPSVGNHGTISLKMSGELPAPPHAQTFDFYDGFDGDTLNLNWNFIREYEKSSYSLDAKKGYIRLSGEETELSTPCASPVFIGIRQPDFNVTACADMCCSPSENQKSGMTVFYNSDYHYEIYLTRQNGKIFVCLAKRIADLEAVTEKREVTFDGKIEFRVIAGTDFYRFSFRCGGEWMELGKGITAALSTESTHTMTFTGNFIGLFSVRGDAYFDSFSLAESNRD